LSSWRCCSAVAASFSGLMGDAAKGIRAFKDGLKDDDQTATRSSGTLTEAERAQRERDEVKG
jgi:sec-independent protein translocase protein TatA